MEFGVTLPHFRQIASPEGIVQVAQHAEALGYSAVWVTDHIVVPDMAVERFGEVFYEPLTVLSYAAAVTTRVRLGTSVVIMPYRNPLFVAKSLATTDVLSGGRVILGVGVGWAEDEFRSLGVSFPDRGALTDEALRIITHVWNNPHPDFRGRFWQIDKVTFRPQPVQQPRPPIWIGGNTSRALRRVAEFGDVWHPTRPTLELIRQGRQRLAQLGPRYNRDLRALPVAFRHPCKLTDTPQGPDPQKPLIGTEEEITRSLEAFQNEGVTHVILDLFYSAPELHQETVDSVLQTMERFAERVMPSLKR